MSETSNGREYKLKEGQIYQFDGPNGEHPLNSVMMYFQLDAFDPKDVRTAALKELLCEIIEMPSYKAFVNRQEPDELLCTCLESKGP